MEKSDRGKGRLSEGDWLAEGNSWWKSQTGGKEGSVKGTGWQGTCRQQNKVQVTG